MTGPEPRSDAGSQSGSDGAPGPRRPHAAPKLGPEVTVPDAVGSTGLAASTAIFPTVFGAGVTMTSLGDPLVGRLLDGRYQITQRLARGGMATVYQAVDTRLTRTVAVKIMHVGLGDDVEFARKFDREARAAALLSHPNVVSVFDQGQDATDGHITRPYIVMEFVDGRTLRDVINHEAPMPPLRALEMIEPVLAALASAHDAGLVHRDVKPENVLISDRGQIKVADFGLAKAISSQTQTATQGLLIGTVSYLPPELVVSGRADARSDVYSAGVVLFELLTGCKPHTGETPIQVAYAHVHTDVPAPSTFTTAGPIPAYLDALVARATARDSAQRPHDARVLLAQVRRVRAALREGVWDDPELTQDLSPVAAAYADRTADELTQVVPTGGDGLGPPRPAAGLRPGPHFPGAYAAGSSGTGPTEPTQTVATGAGPRPDYAAPTVVDALPPPPMVQAGRPPHHEAVERVRARRERQQRKRRRGWLALLLVLLLTAGAALTVYYLTEGRFTSAPALTSLSKAEAAQVAERTGLQIHFGDAYSETVARGLVVSTDPGAGTKVPDGSRIEALVSQGPERYPMPEVIGLTQSAASTALVGSHLTLGKVRGAYDESVAAGVVLSASSRTGTALKPQAAVDLVVSRGPAPVTVKDYRGKDADATVAALQKAGLVVVVKTANDDKVAAGRVLAQDPQKGSLDRGATITLTRSLGPVLVTVPNVRSMGVKAATQVMKDAGFKVKVQAVAINYIGVGFVVYSRPGQSDQAPKGSTVTLYVV
ncbi:MAG: pkaF [Friedmanniella sp.]|nr:pkaF [Friedmanniella sp.]